MAFDSLERLHGFMPARLQQVIARHDILRTGVVWEGLDSPVQVVWREAQLVVQQVLLDPPDGDILEQLHARFDARHFRLDINQAPLMRMVYAEDPANEQVGAIAAVPSLGSRPHRHGRGRPGNAARCCSTRPTTLPPPMPYRNYVAQARLGVDAQEHEAFFREMLGDIDEPTLPFGLQDVQGDGRDIEEARQALDAALNLRLREQARQLGVSAASLMHLAWAQVLGVVSGRRRCGVRHGVDGAHAGRRGRRPGAWACSSTPCRCGWISPKACAPG